MGDVEVMYTVHLWLVGKRVVDFLLVLTANLTFFASSYETQTDRHTHAHAHDDGYYPRRATPRG